LGEDVNDWFCNALLFQLSVKGEREGFVSLLKFLHTWKTLKLDNQNSRINSRPENWRNWLLLSLRWLAGGLVGFVVGLFLFILGETVHPPLLGPIIAGQEELFNELMFYVFDDYFGSSDLIYGASFLAYSAIWMIIGALLLSGRSKQIKTGAILLILYVMIGCLWYVYWAFRMIPT